MDFRKRHWHNTNQCLFPNYSNKNDLTNVIINPLFSIAYSQQLISRRRMRRTKKVFVPHFKATRSTCNICIFHEFQTKPMHVVTESVKFEAEWCGSRDCLITCRAGVLIKALVCFRCNCERNQATAFPNISIELN